MFKIILYLNLKVIIPFVIYLYLIFIMVYLFKKYFYINHIFMILL